MRHILVWGGLLSLCFLRFSPVSAKPLPTSETWQKLSPSSSTFTARNTHASCVFKGKIWVVGGKTDPYPAYNLMTSDKACDVWSTDDGILWNKELSLDGDFYAQQDDVNQPGINAPFYPRFGHALTAFDTNNDGEDDVMIMTGGFAPGPANDVWVTEDGTTWRFCGMAPWSARGWHSTVVVNNTFWLFGGTPLNNELWYIDSIARNYNRPLPLTRARVAAYTYSVEWRQWPELAGWTPRCASGVLVQACLTCAEPFSGRDRVLLMGGYGGPLPGQEGFDGLRTRADVWQTFDGHNWTKLADSTAVSEIGWQGMATWEPVKAFAREFNPRMWVVGGGSVGTFLNKQINTLTASSNNYWSRDGVTWFIVNDQLGGGNTGQARYSSAERASTDYGSTDGRQ